MPGFWAACASLCLLAAATSVKAEPIPGRTTDFILSPGPRDPFAVTVTSDGFRIMGVNISGSAAVIRASPDGTLAWTYTLPPLSGLVDVVVDPSSGVYVYSSVITFLPPTFPFPPAPPTPKPFVTRLNTTSGIPIRTVEVGVDLPGGERMGGPSGAAIDPGNGFIYTLFQTYNSILGVPKQRAEIYDRELARIGSFDFDRHTLNFTTPWIGVDSAGAVWVAQLEYPQPPTPNFFGVERFSAGLTTPTTKFYELAAPVVGNSRVVRDPRGGVVVAGDLDVFGPQDHFRRVDTNGFAPAFRLPTFAMGPMTVDNDGNLYVGGTDPGTGVPAIVKRSTENLNPWSPPYLNLSADRMVEALNITPQGRLHVVGTVFGPGPGAERIFWSEYGEASSSCTITAVPTPVGTVTKTVPISAKVMCDSIPKDGVAVRFTTSTAPSGSALSSTFTITNSSGVAVSTLTFGIMTGTYTVTATCDECTPTSITLAAHARLFMAVEVSTPILKPVPFSNVVGADQRTEVKVRLFGVGGSTDVVAGYPVVLESAAEEGSGGHDHHTNRPRGSLSGPGLTPQPNGIAGTSDSSGTMIAVFISTYFSGVELFTARSTVDANFTPSVSTAVIRAGNFVLLPSATFYAKDGGTCRHFGPAGTPGCDAPDRNHYGTTVATTAIATAAAEWLNFAGAGRMLEINDMSLPLGGGFDVGGNWSGDIVDKSPGDSSTCNPVGHCEHRDGNTVDFQVKPGLSPSSPGTLTEKQQDKLRAILRSIGGTHIHEEGSHWHVRF